MNRTANLFFVCISLLFLSSCGWRTVRGDGDLTTIKRSHQDFKGVKTAGAFDLYVTQGTTYEVKIEAEENLLKYIVTEVNDNVLVVKVKKGINLRPRKDIKLFVTAPVFRELSIAGSGNIVADDDLRSNETVSFSIAGSGDISVSSIHAPRVKVKIAGSGNVTMNGETRTAEYRIAGSGDIKCADLKAENAEVHIAGSGGVWLYASQSLDVHISGGGDVYYKGNPVNVKKHIAGSGNLVAQ